MSYLNNLRMVFSGKFQSDVSTVNNDVRHYDNEIFQPEFQQFQEGDEWNGWWNPCGSAAFRLIDCRVTQVGYLDGSTTSNSAQEPVIGMLIGGSNQRVSGKMVDLDPQMQMVSEIWGLNMRLTNGEVDGFFSGTFQPAPFRDIIFGRQQNSGGGDQTATAIYQSVLTDLSWITPEHSRFLQQLKAIADRVGKLSVRMMVYGYNTSSQSPDFTLGRVSGVIGPAFPIEPDSFVLGRRFAPANSVKTRQGINFFNAQAESEQSNICVDLSNALPLYDGEGTMADIGPLQLAVLTNDAQQGDSINNADGDFVSIGGEIPYLQDQWMHNTGALFNVTNLSAAEINLLQQNPVALIQPQNAGNAVVMIRETPDGLLVRADQIVHRLYPTATANTDFYASRYGVPSAGEEIRVTVAPPLEGQGGGGPGVPTYIPVINIPASAISLGPNAVTDRFGRASYTYFATPPGNPRGYIEGQMYLLNYKPVNDPNYIQQNLDILANLVFDRSDVPAHPTWQDIQPILTQYGNLYPIMSRMLVDLGNYDSVKKHRSILELAFSLPVSDPNYMPVTRDLSPPKRAMILKWLRLRDADGNYLLPYGEDRDENQPHVIEPCESCENQVPPPATQKRGALAEAAHAVSNTMGSKELAAHQLNQATKRK